MLWYNRFIISISSVGSLIILVCWNWKCPLHIVVSFLFPVKWQLLSNSVVLCLLYEFVRSSLLFLIFTSTAAVHTRCIVWDWKCIYMNVCVCACGHGTKCNKYRQLQWLKFLMAECLIHLYTQDEYDSLYSAPRCYQSISIHCSFMHVTIRNRWIHEWDNNMFVDIQPQWVNLIMLDRAWQNNYTNLIVGRSRNSSHWKYSKWREKKNHLLNTVLKDDDFFFRVERTRLNSYPYTHTT